MAESALTVPVRRAEDRLLPFLLVRCGRVGAGLIPLPHEDGIPGGRFELDVAEPAEVLPGLRLDANDAGLLLDFGEDGAVLVAGAAVRRLPPGMGGRELIERATTGVTAWKQERVREWRERQLGGQLITFARQLGAASTPAGVYDVLLRGTERIVGAYTSFLYLPTEDGRTLQLVHSPLWWVVPEARQVIPHDRFRRAGLVRAAEAQPDTGGPLSGLAPLFSSTGAALLAHAPFQGTGVLILAERRQHRVLEPSDWDHLHTLVCLAETALDRIALLDEVRDLSLTDPLTGLANRRRMEVFLEHAWGAAQRGESFSVAMLDLDNFKEINDTRGHLEGDRILRVLADRLRELLRSADLAVRYGGDEFLLLLPGTDLAGAGALLQRIRSHLAGEVELSGGAAEYDPKMKSPEELIALADRRLLAAKHGRHRPPAR